MSESRFREWRENGANPARPAYKYEQPVIMPGNPDARRDMIRPEERHVWTFGSN